MHAAYAHFASCRFNQEHSKSDFVPLYGALMRPHLECCPSKQLGHAQRILFRVDDVAAARGAWKCSLVYGRMRPMG